MDALCSFRKAWEEGLTPDLAAFVAGRDEAVPRGALVELIAVDLDRRWRRGHRPLIEEYLGQWPELRGEDAVVARLLSAECVARGAYQRSWDRDELVQRFPAVAARLPFAELERQAELVRQRESYAGSGRYFLVREIDKGGMGVVFAAWDRERQGLVALKTLPRLEPRLLLRFKREFHALEQVVHENLVPLYEMQACGENWFFTMELVEGMNLLAYLRSGRLWLEREPATPSPSGEEDTELVSPLPECRVNVPLLEDVFRQLVTALTAMHVAGILHRDVKPSNILIRPDGRLVLLDFGLVAGIGELSPAEAGVPAESESESESRSTSFVSDYRAVVGTATYMSPEQAAGQPLTTATDWYSVGVILFQALTRQKLFDGPREQMLRDKQALDPQPPSAVCRGVPPNLDDLCLQLLQRDPRRRPGGQEILARLNTAAGAGTRTATAAGTAASSLAAASVLPERDAPFVGRQEHFRELQAALQEMLAGRLVVLDVCGPSGVGKTRLLRHFLNAAEKSHSILLLHGRCYERESVPYKALDMLMDSLCRYLNARPAAELIRLLPHDWPALTRLFPVLRQVAETVGRPSSAAPPDDLDSPTVSKSFANDPLTALAPPPVDAQVARQQATQALQEVLRRMSDRQPLVLWIDDLQWDDRDSAAVLAALVEQIHDARLMVVLSVRSEQKSRAQCLLALDDAMRQPADASRRYLRRSLVVSPLQLADAEELAAELLRKRPHLPRSVAAMIARQSRGTPFFVQELARYVLSQADGSLPAGNGSELDLQQVLAGRIQRLSEAERRLLEMVAVSGRPLKLCSAYSAAGISAADWPSLVSLCATHLLQTTGPTLHDEADVFHDQLREAVLSLLPAERLGVCHARLATALEQHRDDPEAIASHFQRAGQPTEAIRHFTIAAERAADALAFERAARLFQSSLDLDPHSAAAPRVVRKLADALANAGQGRAAAEAYLRAAAAADVSDQLDLRCQAAYHLCASGHIAAGRQEFSAILSRVGMRLPQSPLAAIASALWHRGRLRLRGLGFHERAVEELPAGERLRVDLSWYVSLGLTMIDTIHAADYQARNLLLALQAGEPYRIVRALAWQAAHTATVGQPARGQANRLLDAAESMVVRVNQPHATALLAVSRGIAAFFQADWPRAVDCCDQGDAILRDHCRGVIWERATARSFSLWSLFFLGRTCELMRRQPDLLREARQRGDRLAEASLTNLSGTLMSLARDQPNEALDSLAAAMQPWQGLGFRTQHFTSLASHIQIALYTGDFRGAGRRLAAEWPQLRRSLLLQIEAIRIFMWHLRGSCALAAAAAEPREDYHLREAQLCARRLRRERAAWGRALGEVLQAAVLHRGGDESRAIGLLGVAAAHLEESHLGLHAAAARWQQGQLTGGDAGRSLVASAQHWLREQQIVNLPAMIDLYAPGFSSRGT